jgi:hypothetical protein
MTVIRPARSAWPPWSKTTLCIQWPFHNFSVTPFMISADEHPSHTESWPRRHEFHTH